MPGNFLFKGYAMQATVYKGKYASAIAHRGPRLSGANFRKKQKPRPETLRRNTPALKHSAETLGPETLRPETLQPKTLPISKYSA